MVEFFGPVDLGLHLAEALALKVRTVALQSGGSPVAASFLAALAVGATAQMLPPLGPVWPLPPC